tara:strand:- start:8 stop:151 length:144 start_codon:yes stop_codon:yes gene_type:complete
MHVESVGIAIPAATRAGNGGKNAHMKPTSKYDTNEITNNHAAIGHVH